MPQIFIFLIAIFLASPIFPDDEETIPTLPEVTPTPLPQPTRERNYYENWMQALGKFSDLYSGITGSQSLDLFLFNSFVDINQTIYTVPIPTPFPAGIGISVGGSRKVVGNQGIDEFYTVTDKFRFSVRPYLAATAYGFSIGVSTPIEFYVTNIRQVGPKEIQKLDPIEKSYQMLEKDFRRKKKSSVGIEGMEKTDKEFYANFFPSEGESIERKATWSRFWNPITMNFRLPLTPRAAERMAQREILTYNILGGIEIGGGFGLPMAMPSAADKSVLKPGIDVSVYFKGSFEVVVLRERALNQGDNYFRVKITRAKGVGYSLGFGSGFDTLGSLTSGQTGPLEGNFIWTTAGGLISIRPFRISWDQSYWFFLNHVYRFDMNKSEARDAYQKMVLGNLKLAEKLAFDEKGNIRKDSPVTRIVTSVEKARSKGHSRGINLFLLTLKKDGIIKNTDKILIDENLVQYHYFESEALNSRVVQELFKFQESRTHQFTTRVDLNSFNKTPRKEDSLFLFVNASLSDSFTVPKEYIQYIKEVEESLNLRDFFPLPPLHKDMEWFKGKLGLSKFDYQLKINLPQMEKFINYPEEKMWDALILAFDAQGKGWDTESSRRKQIAKSVGIYAATLPASMIGQKFPPKDAILMAKIKHSRWVKLKEEYSKGAKEFVKALGDFFNIGDYGPEMIKLIRVVLSGEKIPYKLNATNPIIADNSNINRDEIGDLTSPLDVANYYVFERWYQNFEKVNITHWGAELIANQYIRFTVGFDKEPKSVFFNMERTRVKLSLGKTYWGSVVISNKKGIFKKGLNTIMVKIGDKKHPWNHLVNLIEVKQILFPEEFKFSIAGSLDEKRYGLTSSAILKVTFIENSKELDKYLKYTIEDFKICMARSAMDLILFLEKRPLLLCPETAPHYPDGTCKEGIYPYGWFKNAALDENIKKRNAWIFANCPKEGSEEFISKIIQRENICMGKSPFDIIEILGDRPFYVCPQNSLKNPDGTCVSGMIPYKFDPDADNLNSRNDWIKKYCSH